MKKNRIFSALVSVVLACSALIPLTGCNDKALSEKDLTYFSVYNTYKVRQDEMPPEKEILPADSLEITMVQGEYEILQLIMNSEKDVDWYNATISDLVNVADSSEVYKSENVAVAKQNYMYVGYMGYRTVNWSDYGYSAGYYPDALIPMNAVINYGQNSFKAGLNQGLTFQFSTRPELDENDIAILKDGITELESESMTDKEKFIYNKPGTYEGTITLDFKTFKKEIPVTLNIADATVSETAHVTGSFGMRNTKFNAELDWTQRASDLWNDAIVKYRYTPERLTTEQGSGQPQRDLQLSLARKLLSNDRACTWSFPGSYASAGFDGNFADDTAWHEQYPDLKGKACFSTDIYMKQLDDFVQFSIEDDVNYLDRLILDCAPDEPASNGKFLETKASGLSLRKLKEYYSNVIDLCEGTDFRGNKRSEYKAKYEALHPGKSWEVFKDEMVASIRGFQMPVATSWAESYAEYVDCFSPPISHYSTEGQREKYKNQELQWWYAFVHDIEGNSLPERMLGWMQAEWGIKAQSDWAVDCFNDKYNGGIVIDDYFNTLYQRSNYGNGDGYYFYPAAQYELDELIPSFRIQAKVDAYEEYELFYNLKQTYAKIAEKTELNIDPTGVISGLGKNLYTGSTGYIMDCANFEATRRALINLSKCTESSAQMCIASVTDNGYGQVKYQIYLKANPDGSARVLKNNGQQVQPSGGLTGGGYLYDVIIDRTTSANNNISLEFVTDEGETLVYSQGIGGKVTVVEAEEIIADANFEAGTAEVSGELVGTIYALEGEQGSNDVEIIVYGADAEGNEDEYVGIYVTSPKINSLFSSSTMSMMFNFYNPSNEPIMITSIGILKDRDDAKQLFSVELQPGLNRIEVSAKGNDWAKYPLEFMIWTFEQNGSPMYKDITLYLKDIVVYEA